ncbi:MAG TPA: hypothetical protein VFU68_08155, partial [Terracidiphilus sp.]|nr:hypothetical protein [Terracidiphilus sp.]
LGAGHGDGPAADSVRTRLGKSEWPGASEGFPRRAVPASKDVTASLCGGSPHVLRSMLPALLLEEWALSRA